MCVKKLVRHIMNETRKMFVGTTHEHDFLVYHVPDDEQGNHRVDEDTMDLLDFQMRVVA